MLLGKVDGVAVVVHNVSPTDVVLGIGVGGHETELVEALAVKLFRNAFEPLVLATGASGTLLQDEAGVDGTGALDLLETPVIVDADLADDRGSGGFAAIEGAAVPELGPGLHFGETEHAKVVLGGGGLVNVDVGLVFVDVVADGEAALCGLVAAVEGVCGGCSGDGGSGGGDGGKGRKGSRELHRK